MKNNIPININYLVEKSRLSQDDFGEMFGLGKGILSTYTRGRSQPKIETLQRIAKYYNITVDDLLNKDLAKAGIYAGGLAAPAPPQMVQEEKAEYNNENEIVELLKERIKDKDEVIEALKQRLNDLTGEKDKTKAG